MQIRTRTMVWSAAGLLAVGTATGLCGPSLLQSASRQSAAAATTAAPTDSGREAPSQPVPQITAPNYRAIVARNQAAVVGITTAGPMTTSSPQEFGDSNGNDNPFAQFFRGQPT